ncbi:hypothetical protein SISSUDRAFT_1067228 [Sistotremastrum suecicum HHB10207 ss-3]|uniref:Uncharacterized protein n=1 Tax=Sistotremastrum suecicum HHB10207 ss-3 TaxID=1314776 RepID=A0A165XCF6_9AGAM|nr:hypothetical protein SISSUDRAFT_1067228 [Sistotremastrum suecicum HHB10207 ss-3]
MEGARTSYLVPIEEMGSVQPEDPRSASQAGALAPRARGHGGQSYSTHNNIPSPNLSYRLSIELSDGLTSTIFEPGSYPLSLRTMKFDLRRPLFPKLYIAICLGPSEVAAKNCRIAMLKVDSDFLPHTSATTLQVHFMLDHGLNVWCTLETDLLGKCYSATIPAVAFTDEMDPSRLGDQVGCCAILKNQKNCLYKFMGAMQRQYNFAPDTAQSAIKRSIAKILIDMARSILHLSALGCFNPEQGRWLVYDIGPFIGGIAFQPTMEVISMTPAPENDRMILRSAEPHVCASDCCECWAQYLIRVCMNYVCCNGSYNDLQIEQCLGETLSNYARTAVVASSPYTVLNPSDNLI